jgi:glucose/arabinose dehydrogenase
MVVCSLVIIFASRRVDAQSTPDPDPVLPCEKPIPRLFIDRSQMCGEVIFDDELYLGVDALGTLTILPDDSILFTRPATREIVLLRSTGSGLYEAPRTVATLQSAQDAPMGITYYDGTVVVSGDGTITRYRLEMGGETLTDPIPLVDDLPSGAGGWLGNIHIHNERIYVAKAACEGCADSDPRRGALLSFALDGSDMRIEARGLRDAFDFDWHPATGDLYIVDSERPEYPAELNRLNTPETHFGYPDCDPFGSAVNGTASCSETTPPILTFDPQSTPRGIVFYDGEAFPQFRGQMLVTLAGSWNAPVISGYELRSISLETRTSTRFLPLTGRPTADATLVRTSFYPYRLTNIAVDSRGWIVIGVAEGRIYRVRPV